MTLWLDAQLPPLLASWINAQEGGIQAFVVRDVGLWDASEPEIFRAAREAGIAVMTKVRDAIRLLEEQRHPPLVIWLRLGNPEKLPGFHDPSAGGGTSLLEAQRLGLEAHASDMNPVAVLINKAMIEITLEIQVTPLAASTSRRYGSCWRTRRC